MAQYFNCGFARVAVYEITKETSKTSMALRSCNQNDLVAQFEKRFQKRSPFLIPNDNFVRNAKQLLPMFHKKWIPASSRNEYHACFSEESWKMLSSTAKSLHSLQACNGCFTTFPLLQSKFPGNLKREKNKYTESSKLQLKRLQKKQTIPFCNAKKTALAAYENIADQFEESTGHSLNVCLTSNPKSKLQVRATKEQKQKRRDQARAFKKIVEGNYKQSAVSTVLGTKQEHLKASMKKLD